MIAAMMETMFKQNQLNLVVSVGAVLIKSSVISCSFREDGDCSCISEYLGL